MSSPISLLYARVYIHATEDPKKVLSALNNVVNGPYVVRVARGHHGNEIQVVETRLSDVDALEALKSILARLDDLEFILLLSGVEGSRLYVKFDKQKAFHGVLKVSQGDDVVYLEVRSRAISVGDFRSFLISLREALKT